MINRTEEALAGLMMAATVILWTWGIPLFAAAIAGIL